MCITLLTKYACGHESTGPMCKKRACKKNETHTRTKNHACTKCSNTYMTQLREECDDSKRRLQDADSAYAGALERIEALEGGYRSIKRHNVKLIEQLKSLTQSVRDPWEREDESLGRIEALSAELKTTRLKVPKNECIYTEILRYYACGHDTKEICSTKGTPREDCQYKQILGTDCDEICGECQVQEKVKQEAAMTGLMTVHAAQERTVHDLRSQMRNLEELCMNRKELWEITNELTHRPALTKAIPLAPKSLPGPSDEHNKDNTFSRLERLSVVNIMEGLSDLQETGLLEGEALVEELRLSGMIEDRWDGDSARSVLCFAGMDVHLKKEFVNNIASTSIPSIEVSTSGCVDDSQLQGDKSQEQSTVSVRADEDNCTCDESHVRKSTAVLADNTHRSIEQPPKPPKTSTSCSKSDVGFDCFPGLFSGV